MNIKFKLLLFVLLSLLVTSCVSNKPYPDSYLHSIDLFSSGTIPGGQYIKIKINGNSYMALLDTGTSHTALMLDQSILDTFKLPSVGTSNYLYSEGYVQSERYILPDVIINDDLFVANATCEKLPNIPNVDIQALAGLPLFEQYNFLLSYKQKKIFLYDKKSELDFLKSWTKIPLLEDEQGLFFYGNIQENDKQYIFYLDTATYSFRNGKYLDNVFNLELGNILNEKNRLNYFLSNRKFTQNNFIYIQNENIPVDLFLGYPFLSQYDVYIDLDNHSLYIER